MSANAKILLRQAKAGIIGKSVVDAVYVKKKITKKDYEAILEAMRWND